jgi:hypothetical protein
MKPSDSPAATFPRDIRPTFPGIKRRCWCRNGSRNCALHRQAAENHDPDALLSRSSPPLRKISALQQDAFTLYEMAYKNKTGKRLPNYRTTVHSFQLPALTTRKDATKRQIVESRLGSASETKLIPSRKGTRKAIDILMSYSLRSPIPLLLHRSCERQSAMMSRQRYGTSALSRGLGASSER